jgi:protein TonB
MATTEVTTRRAVPVLALMFSLTLHAAAFAALLADWRGKAEDEPVLSVELVIVSSPLESDSVEEASEGAPAREEPSPQEPPRAEAAPPPEPPQQQAVEPPPPPQPPKPVAKAEPPKPVPPRPQPAPRAYEPPVNLNPGALGDEPQQAKAPASSDASNSFSVLHGPIPPYPPAARSRGQEGRVVLDVAIGTDGVPREVGVAHSSGAPLLDESAVNTVKTWRFRNDSGRVLTVSVPIVFELRSTAGR